MKTFNTFKYVKPGEVEIPTDSHVVLVPNGITDAKQLLSVLNEKLSFPYFGFNWNALSDCLRDLQWIKERHVILIHNDLPALNAPDLENYLGVLDECIREWQTRGIPRLVVVFPEACGKQIAQI